MDCAGVSSLLDDMTEEAKERLAADGFGSEKCGSNCGRNAATPARATNWRWRRPPATSTIAGQDALRERFHAEHQRAYLRAYRDMPVRVINLGVSASVPGTPLVSRQSPDTGAAAAEPALTAPCLFPGAAEAQPTSFFLPRRSHARPLHRRPCHHRTGRLHHCDSAGLASAAWTAYSNLHLTRL